MAPQLTSQHPKSPDRHWTEYPWGVYWEPTKIPPQGILTSNQEMTE